MRSACSGTRSGDGDRARPASWGGGVMREGRVLSRRSPAMPPCMKRSCQRQTQFLLFPTRRVISTQQSPPDEDDQRRSRRRRHPCAFPRLASTDARWESTTLIVHGLRSERDDGVPSDCGPFPRSSNGARTRKGHSAQGSAGLAVGGAYLAVAAGVDHLVAEFGVARQDAPVDCTGGGGDLAVAAQ